MLVTYFVVNVRNKMFFKLRLGSQRSTQTFLKDFVIYHKTDLLH